jgi:hypothetical protein
VEAGNPGRRVLAVRRAWAVVVAGAAAVAVAVDEISRCSCKGAQTSSPLLVRCLTTDLLEDSYVAQQPQNRCYDPVSTAGANRSPRRLQQVR